MLILVWLTGWLLLVYTDGKLDWEVAEKITDYGQNLTLFCEVDKCCTETSGWLYKESQTIYIDIRIIKEDPTSKYGTFVRANGFGLVIRKLNTNDINITYSCSYGFEISEKKLLQFDDVFIKPENTTTDVTAEEGKSHGGEIIGSIAGGVIVVVVIIVIAMVYRNQRISSTRTSRTKETQGDDVEMTPLQNNTGDDVEMTPLQKNTGDDVEKTPLQNNTEETPVKKMEPHMSTMDNKLKSENDNLKAKNSEMVANTEAEELPSQITALQKEVRQEKLAHNSTKEDLENLRKQMSVVKEEVPKLQTKAANDKSIMDSELKAKDQDRDNTSNELRKLKVELAASKQGEEEAAGKVKSLKTKNTLLTEENKVLIENFNSERILRKKYYNMVEDMKGKIRVYCRARPMSETELSTGNVSVLKSRDEYSISVDSSRGVKKFKFDQIFMENTTQEEIFEDTHNLIQSAVDGYNVCIFAYGQTGSGKTFTMIGDKEQNSPGIAPRAFKRIFKLIHDLKSKYTIEVTAYMMELYNDKLIDLFSRPGTSSDEKMEIKVETNGWVRLNGAVVKTVHNSEGLLALFEKGSNNRHTASTKMNHESSRSHLVISIVMESTNKTTKQKTIGKLSLVDLAGSENVKKTEATVDQFKEAKSINLSLSALGNVISALGREQQHIPYRDSKLTWLMQDSLGGNAKTLMYVNISPAKYNQDESVNSLTYAERVKRITRPQRIQTTKT